MSSGSKNENFDSIEFSGNVSRKKSSGNMKQFKSNSLNKNNHQVSDQFEEIKSQNSLKQESMNEQSFEEKNNTRRKSQNVRNHIHQFRLAKFMSEGNNKQKSAQKQNNHSKNKVVQKRQTETNLQAKLNDEVELKNEQVKIVRRKGRPPKSLALIREKEKQFNKQKEIRQSQLQEQNDKIVQQNFQVDEEIRRTERRKMVIRKRGVRLQAYRDAETQTTLTQNQIQDIKNNLDNPEQLVKILLQMNIKVGNIKQILELGVSQALNDVPTNRNVIFLLNTLKATLLHKYFPDDNKQRKIYEKIAKERKNFVLRSRFQQNHSEEQQMIDEYKIITRPQQKNEDKSKQNIKKPKKNQIKMKKAEYEKQKLQKIRAKANSKLQKIIRRSGVYQGAQQLTMEIQKTFQETAEAKNILYRKIAYKRMRSIKDKLIEMRENKSTPQEVKQYLEQSLEIYRFQSIRRQQDGHNEFLL